MITYQNGNSTITLDKDGSRVIEFEDELKLDLPLNLDIRISTECSLANLCSFCHESASIKGKDCDFDALKFKLEDLPEGIELAVGCNRLTTNLYDFLQWCHLKNYIVNLTVNQGHLKRNYELLKLAIDNNLVKGLGISYRSSLKWNIPKYFLNYSNTVFHVITGIDTITDVKTLVNKGVKKILVLGEKDFGANSGKVNLNSRTHKEWLWWIKDLFTLFEVVSFDNLAIEQLKLKRFFNAKSWQQFHQGEYSFYINAVDQTFSRSSRHPDKVSWSNYTIQQYFKTLKEYEKIN